MTTTASSIACASATASLRGAAREPLDSNAASPMHEVTLDIDRSSHTLELDSRINATGIHVRDYPITLDKLLRGLAAIVRTDSNPPRRHP